MAIPDYQTIMLPLMKYSGDEEEHSLPETIEALADEFKLTDEERREMLPSGKQETFRNRVAWALTYMRQAALVKTTRRGYFRITERGKEVLSQNPDRIDAKFLEQFPEFIEFRQRRKKGEKDKKENWGQPLTLDKAGRPRNHVSHPSQADFDFFLLSQLP